MSSPVRAPRTRGPRDHHVDRTHSTVDFEGGAWVHRITPVDGGGALPGTSPAIDGFATAALAELERIREYRPIDVVYGPAWDMEILPIIRMTDIPTVVLLATPVADHQQPRRRRRLLPGFLRLIAAGPRTRDVRDGRPSPRRQLRGGGNHRERYPQPLDPLRVAVAALGSSTGRRRRRRSGRQRRCSEGRRAVRRPTRTPQGRRHPARGHRAPRPRPAAAPRPRRRSRQPGRGRRPLVRGKSRRRAEPWLGRVEFLGKVSDDELEILYERADIVALPSRYESFGLTIVEGDASRHRRRQHNGRRHPRADHAWRRGTSRRTR